MERLLGAAASLRVGNPEEPGTTVGPVIDEAAYKRILEYIEIGVGIDNHGVFATHLANHVLELALALARLAGAFINSQAHFARAGERDQIDILVIDHVRADDRSYAIEKIQHAGRHAGFLKNFQ
jgi:hypothetical protein